MYLVPCSLKCLRRGDMTRAHQELIENRVVNFPGSIHATILDNGGDVAKICSILRRTEHTSRG